MVREGPGRRPDTCDRPGWYLVRIRYSEGVWIKVTFVEADHPVDSGVSATKEVRPPFSVFWGSNLHRSIINTNVWAVSRSPPPDKAKAKQMTGSKNRTTGRHYHSPCSTLFLFVSAPSTNQGRSRAKASTIYISTLLVIGLPNETTGFKARHESGNYGQRQIMGITFLPRNVSTNFESNNNLGWSPVNRATRPGGGMRGLW